MDDRIGHLERCRKEGQDAELSEVYRLGGGSRRCQNV